MKVLGVQNGHIKAAAIFKRPIFVWSPETSARFFRALHDSLSGLLYIQPNDLVATGGMSLADCSASLRVFGGNNTLTLKANGILAEFPFVASDRLQFTDQIILQGYSAIREEFKELEITTIEANAGYHMKVENPDDFRERLRRSYLGQISLPSPEKLVLEPSMRFRVTSNDGVWTVRITIEKSESATADLFLHRELLITKLEGLSTPQQQYEMIQHIDETVRDMLGLTTAQ